MKAERRRSLLLVDDDDVDRLSFMRALRSVGSDIDVTEVSTVAEARRRIEVSDFDWIVIDHQLPDGEGVELVRFAQAMAPFLPAIVLTGRGDESLAAELIREGARDYIPKSQLSPGRLAQGLETATRLADAARAASEVERAQRFLAGPGAAMLSSIDRDEVLRATVDSCAGPYADLCIVDLLETEDELQRAAAGFASAEIAICMGADFQGRSRRLQTGSALARLLAGGGPQRIPALDEAWLEELDLKRLPRSSPDQAAPSAILVPLRARGRSLGLLVLVSARPDRGHAASDMALAEIYGSRVAMALDNARLYQETQRAVRMREEVLAVVAHDLRNLLNTMKAGVHLLLEIELPEEGRARHLTSLARASDRMNHLIADLLDISRMESGLLTVERVPLSPAALVDEAAEQMRPLADAAQVRLHVEADADLPPILGDPERLLRVIFNLVTNAIRYSPADGSIRLIANSRNGSVRMGVADEGPGIPEDELPSLFVPFWQSERRSRGTAGLGLAIAGAIVELHGGAIRVESREGTGSTFWIDLPAADAGVFDGTPVDTHDSAATGY